MDKIDTATPDLTMENEAKLLDLFPQVATEVIGEDGKVSRAVDFDALRELLGDVAEGQRERYQFTWPGKRAAKEETRKPISKTLRPCPEKSVNWDSTENLYIEGDNLEALKLLRETYAGKVKMIYIDPPYNTGNDFVYDDDFACSIEDERRNNGAFDDEGNLLDEAYKRNQETNGRFHSDWCSMMYPRLVLARDLLSDDGVIFISIDDNEQENLQKICDEIFGDNNFVAQFTWEKKKKGSFLSSSITNVIEYILCYAKSKRAFKGLIGEINSDTATYPCVNAVNGREIRVIPSGIDSKYRKKDYTLPAGSIISNNTMNLVLHSDLILRNGKLANELTIEGNWRYSQEAMTEFAKKGEIYVTQDLYLRRIVNDERHKTMKDLLPRVGTNREAPVGEFNPDNLFESGWGSNEDADEELRQLMGVQKLLDYPKPVQLIAKLICSARLSNDAVVMDFFSGSATTAHALMKLNANELSNRKFILVQLPEVCDKDSEAIKAGYSTICEIGEERIRRAGAKIKAEIEEANKQPKIGEEPKKVPDVGFRVLRIDSSNFNDVSAAPDQYEQTSIDLFVDNLKPDRTDLDILFQVLPKFRIPLSAKIDQLDIDGKTVFDVNDGQLVACFSSQIDNETIERIAQIRPLYAVFRDACLADDATAANLEELFKTFSPDTVRRVI